MILVEIGESPLITTFFQLAQNKEEIRANLNLLQEVWEVAHVKEYMAKTRGPNNITQKKFPKNSRSPYKIVEEVGKGAYRLEYLDGRKVPCTWNMASLWIYYN
ncbi:hypothetical protein CR513_44910, partial [Mucuna pruriens]